MLNMDHAAFAQYLSEVTEWDELPETIRAWEDDVEPPGAVVMACVGVTRDIPLLDRPLLAAIPPAFPAAELDGPWVTAYQFPSMGTIRHHADIAQIGAESDSLIRAANHPPEPRSEGRATAFRNEIEAVLVGRHLVGTYMNTSDRRYYGTIQMAVHSGENVMEGYFAGVGSDVEVSTGAWKWVRLEAEPDICLADIRLRDPVTLYELVMSRTRNDAPLTLADIREEP
jgi:hypothetical protein